MPHLTTDVASREKDDGSYIANKIGTFVINSPTKPISKDYNNSRKFNNNYTTLLIISLVLLYFTQRCSASFYTAARSVDFSDIYDIPQDKPYECGSIDLRNDCRSFEKLKNCTAVTGFVSMALLYTPGCNISSLKFRKLREITDFFIISEVNNLTSFRDMFPNLTVIRGRVLFINYALLITHVKQLETIEFKSLIAIQRGHVIVESTPKLCFAEKINWDRLTLTRGKNNIFLPEKSNCTQKATCTGCPKDFCWSNHVCQQFESDNVLIPGDKIDDCHSECLGGCYRKGNSSACAVCKGYTDHGNCVSKCRSGLYASSHYLRCYTREECLHKRLYIFKDTCVDSCPVGYKKNESTFECDPCDDVAGCVKVCDNGSPFNDIFEIADIFTAEQFKGCQIYNGSVLINSYEFFDENIFMELLKDMKEITGFLKINRSPFLTNLNFLSNLEKIHGADLEDDLYALIIYNNKNLTDLWNVHPNLQITNGGMYIHANDKLCNRRIRKFRQSIIHDNSLDSIQKSDQDVLCAPAKLSLNVQVRDQNSVLLSWNRIDGLPEIEIIYRPIRDNEYLSVVSEIDTNVCDRNVWHRVLKFSDELEKNALNYEYDLYGLIPNTRYAILVKAFNGEDDTQQYRSEIEYFNTKFDVPWPPKLSVKEKTSDTLLLEFAPGEVDFGGPQIVDYYYLEAYSLPDNKTFLDERNYCNEPIIDFKDLIDDDYDECCAQRESDKSDQYFLSQLKADFLCTKNERKYCTQNYNDNLDPNMPKGTFMRFLEGGQRNYTLKNLENFRLYVLNMKACNKIGCSSYSMLSTRTNYSIEADKISNISYCRVNDTDLYRLSFEEPTHPNGYITSYMLHFRNSDDKAAHKKKLLCITRSAHERNNNLYEERFKYEYDQVAVRVHSLGYGAFVGWINVTSCYTTTKLSGNLWYYSIIIFAAAATIALLYICFKQSCWRTIFPLHSGWRTVRPPPYINEDRQNLVPGFELVQFHNIPREGDGLVDIRRNSVPPE